MQEQVIPKCSCGGKARYRGKGGYCWIECRKCGKRTGFFPRPIFDVENAFSDIVQEWNRMNKS